MVKDVEVVSNNQKSLTASDLMSIQDVVSKSFSPVFTKLQGDLFSTLRELRETDRKVIDDKFGDVNGKIDILFVKVDSVERVCTEFTSTRSGVVTGEGLAKAEARAVEMASDKDGNVLKEVKELRKEVAANKRDTDSQFLTWEKRFAIFDFSLGIPNWVVRNWKTIFVVLCLLGAMFGIVDWNVREVQWANRPPVNFSQFS